MAGPLFLQWMRSLTLVLTRESCDRAILTSWLVKTKDAPNLIDDFIGEHPRFYMTTSLTTGLRGIADILCLTAWVTGYLRLEEMSGHQDITKWGFITSPYGTSVIQNNVKLKRGQKGENIRPMLRVDKREIRNVISTQYYKVAYHTRTSPMNSYWRDRLRTHL